MERAAFRAMGTEVELFLDLPSDGWTAAVFASVRREFARLEAVLSRFRPDSELSVLNSTGRIHAGPDLLRVTELALAARARTGGLFDPTVHDALVAAGYDRTFEELEMGGTVVATRPPRCGGAVAVDARTGEIVLEPGVRLDFGGIGKGYAVDRACDVLAPYGPCLVSAGGDLAVRGGAWPVGVETGAGATTLELSSGAIATSGSDRRRWVTTDGDAHHLIDPRTGAPAESDLLRVTVVGRSAVEAEVLAKALFLVGGVDEATREAERLQVSAVLVPVEGAAVLAGGLA